MKDKNTENITLARDAAGGSREAFCRLYSKYKDNLYRYAYYQLKDPDSAEDAVSDCVLAAWAGISRLRSEEAFGAWIFGILRNICVSRIRSDIREREKIKSFYEDSSPASEAPSPSRSLELKEALDHLSDQERDIVLLSLVSGLTSKEISSVTGLTPGSVRSKLSRSLSRMRTFLE